MTNTNKTSGGTQSTAVKNSTTVSAVKTGDTTDILGYIGAAFIALAAAAGIFFIRKKRQIIAESGAGPYGSCLLSMT